MGNQQQFDAQDLGNGTTYPGAPIDDAAPATSPTGWDVADTSEGDAPATAANRVRDPEDDVPEGDGDDGTPSSQREQAHGGF